MASLELETLKQSVADLKASLMDFDPSPIEPHSNANLLKCQAFVVFSHAEMQVYWESVARRILREAEARWNANQEVGRVVGTLVAFRRSEKVHVPNDVQLAREGGKFDWIVSQAVSAQTTAIEKNNGIKRSNISELLLPLGVFIPDLSETMLIQLDQTGSKRGDMVHKSSRVSLRNIRDPHADEMNDIYELIAEISAFDDKLEALGLLSVPAERLAPLPVAAVFDDDRA